MVILAHLGSRGRLAARRGGVRRVVYPRRAPMLELHWTLLLVAGGLAMAALRVRPSIPRGRFERRAVSTTGTVTEVSATSSGEYPVVRFIPGDGSHVTFRSQVGSPSGTYRVGQAVPVAFDPNDPRLATLETESERAIKRLT